jgi:hypothetical protein
VHTPGPTRDLLAHLRVPASGLVARLTGPAEIALGTWALVTGSRFAVAAVAAAFAGFTAVALALVRGRTTDRSCGCFGTLSARPSWVHVAATALLALAAGGACVAGPAGLPSLVADLAGRDGRGAVVLLMAMSSLATALVVAILTVLPATLDAVRRRPAIEPFRLVRPPVLRSSSS